MEWTGQQVLQLINVYKNYGLLWDPRHPKHFNKISKNEAWEEIATQIDISADECRRKMVSLLASLRREKAKIKKSLGTGSVPDCRSTSVSTPNKLFISLPSDESIRNLWQQAMRRGKFVSNKGTKYCCEDHFNLEEDMENYMYYKTMKCGKIKLKPGVVPHIFNCQNNRKLSHRPKSPAFLKRKNKNIVEDLVRDSCVTEDTKNLEKHDSETACPETSILQESKYFEKYVQVNFKPLVRSKSVQCSFPCSCNHEVFKRGQKKRKAEDNLLKHSKTKLKIIDCDSPIQSSISSQSNASGPDDVYKSSWFAFKPLQFFLDKDKPKGKRTTLQNEENKESTENTDVIEAVSTTVEPQNVPSTSFGKTRKRNVEEDRLDPRILQASASNKEDEDEEIQIFSRLVANKMKKYSPVTCTTVQQEIMNILFNADRGFYDGPLFRPNFLHNIAVQNNYSRCSSISESLTFTSPSPHPIQSPSPLPSALLSQPSPALSTATSTSEHVAFEDLI